MQLTEEQQAAVTLRNRTVLVSAAAGAGKTRVLVERLMGYVTDPVRPRRIDEFLVVTYTRAAAGELRGRIWERLRALSDAAPGDQHLQEQLTRVYTARIGTLDAYCRELLLENATQAGLPSGYRTPDAAELELLNLRVLDETLDDLYERTADDPNHPFRLCADTYGDERGDALLGQLILHIWEKTRTHADPMAWLREVVETFPHGDASWRTLLLGQALCVTQTFLRDYEAMQPYVCGGELAATYGITLQQDLGDLRLLQEVLQQDEWDQAAALLEDYTFATLKAHRGEAPPEADDFKALRDGWKKALTGKVRAFVSGGMERHLRDAADMLPILRGLSEAVHAFDTALTAEKQRLSVLDFTDAQRLTLSLLIANGDPTPLAQRISSRFCEILVDEYQDINPLQDEILTALSQSGRNLFYVGDARQSIYRFQRAEPALFIEKYERFPYYKEAPSDGPCKVLLTQNFRSAKPVLDAVNHVFSRIDCPEMGPLRPENFLRPGQTQPNEHPVEILPDNDEATEPERIARRLRVLIEQGEATAGECVILLRSPKNRLLEYRKALENEGLPCAVSTGGGYWETPEILTMLSALEAIGNARLDIALTSALRGLTGCTPEALASLRLLSDGALCDCLAISQDELFSRFWQQFQAWRALAADLPPYALAARVMADTAFPHRLGGEARERLFLLPEVLRAYAGDLAGLPDWLRSQTAAPPGASEGAEATGVRILSIHGSKGLEFPVVAVAGLGKRLNLQDQQARLLAHPRLGLGVKRRDEYSEYPTLSYRAVQSVMDSETRSEELRLLYVAMTRAQRRLILSPADISQVKPLLSRGDLILKSTVAAWLDGVSSPEWRLAPLEGAKHEQPMGPDDEIAAKIGAFGVCPEPWHYPYPEAVDTPSKLTATGLKGRFPDDEVREDAVDIGEGSHIATDAEQQPLPARRPRFMDTEQPVPVARGTATHLFLQFAEFAKCTQPGGAEGERNRLLAARLLNAAQAQAVDLPAVQRFFTTKRGQALLTAKGLRREQKFSLLVTDGDIAGLALPDGERVLLQGVIDCCYETERGIVLLDFKTDRVKPGEERERARRYRPQMEAYAAALAAMTGKPVCERVLVFLTTQCEVAI